MRAAFLCARCLIIQTCTCWHNYPSHDCAHAYPVSQLVSMKCITIQYNFFVRIRTLVPIFVLTFSLYFEYSLMILQHHQFFPFSETLSQRILVSWDPNLDLWVNFLNFFTQTTSDLNGLSWRHILAISSELDIYLIFKILLLFGVHCL